MNNPMHDQLRDRIRDRLQYSSPTGSAARSFGSSLTGPLGRALAFVAAGVVLIAGLFVSAIVFSVLLVVGTVAGGWFWWKTRDLRKQVGERMAQMQRMQAARRGAAAPQPPADVIDGDFIRETDERR